MNSIQGQRSQLDIQRIQLLYQYAPLTIFGSAFAACIIAYVSFDQLPRLTLTIWLIAALSLVPIRLGMALAFRLATATNKADVRWMLKWEKIWIASAAVPAIVFGASAFLPYEDNHLVIFLFIGLSLASMVGGGIVTCMTTIKAQMLFLHLAIIPFITACLMKSEPYFMLLGLFFGVFYFIFFNISVRINRTIIKAISEKIQRKDLAYKDSLTGLWNRRKLFEIVDQLEGQTYSILMIDIDHFKQLNDREGHQAGDDVLTEISYCIVKCMRDDDLVVRYGGEEFLAVLPSMDLDSATRIADRINAEVAMESKNTVSIGVAYSDLYEDFDDLVNAADKAMYRAKKDGRNCVRADNPHLEKFLSN